MNDQLNTTGGKINCIKCNSKIGQWSWTGLQCSCGAWVVPAFQITKTKVDLKSTQKISNSVLTSNKSILKSIKYNNDCSDSNDEDDYNIQEESQTNDIIKEDDINLNTITTTFENVLNAKLELKSIRYVDSDDDSSSSCDDDGYNDKDNDFNENDFDEDVDNNYDDGSEEDN